MNINSRLADLFSPAGLHPVSFSKLSNGINSNVYKVKCSCGNLYVLKLFPEPERNSVTRFARELTMYESLQKYNNSRIATLIYSCKSSNYAIYSYMPGQIPTSVDSYLLSECIDFLHDLNSPKIFNSFHSVGYASDAYVNSQVIIDSLRQRFEHVFETIACLQGFERLYEWMKTIFSESIETSIHDFLASTSEKTEWQSNSIILSSSDVGIHNLLIVKSSVVFFDFEYSGYDDLSKYALDWVLQPNFPFDLKLESQFLKMLCDRFPHFGADWLERYADTKKLAFYRWILIQLKSFPLNIAKRPYENLASYIHHCNVTHGFSLDTRYLVST